eukprot:32079_1
MSVGLPPPPDISDVDDGDDGDDGDDKESKRERNRIRAISELISTEQTYVDNLRLLNELYYIPLTQSKIIKQKYIQSHFGEIPTIINLNDNLLSTLKKNKSNDRIGEAMLGFIPFLKMYQNYINKHEQSIKLLTELQKNNADFSAFLNLQRKEERAKFQTLQSFLILPIQRVPRYELCLKEIIKLTSADNTDGPNLKQCFDKICLVNKSINERINEHHDREKVKWIESRFAPVGIGQTVSLVAPARTYVREGYLKKVSRKKDILYLFILFSDILIYCSESTRYGLKLHQKLEFDLYFRIKKVDNNRKYGNKCFELNSTQKPFLVICDDNSTRASWFNDVQQCLDKMRRNRKLADSKKMDGRILDVAPVWIPDDFSDRCMIPQCMKKFTFTRRRHHCRYCGRLICSACSKNQLPHFNIQNKEIVRVGTLCYNKYKLNFPDFDLKFNRKNKPSISISNTKGAEYEFNNWDSSSDEDTEDDTESMHSRKTNASISMSSSISMSMSTPMSMVSKPIAVQPPKAKPPLIKAKPPPNQTQNQHIPSESVPAASAAANGRSQAMIQTMQSKLTKQRQHNIELERQIEDLKAENQRLRKSKVDLMTWSNSEIAKYKKEIQFLKDKLKLNQEGV